MKNSNRYKEKTGDSMIITESKRLLFRLMEHDDEECLQNIWCDLEVMRYCGGTVKPERIQKIISYDRTEYSKHGNAVFAVIEKAASRLIGICGCKLDSEDPRRGELICHFVKDVWGKGYATEAVSTYITWLKYNDLMDFLYASAMPSNTASIRLVIRSGFTQNGFVQFEDTGFVDEPYFEMSLSTLQGK